MPISKRVRDNQYVNVRMSTKEFFHLGNHLYQYVTEYNISDKEGKEVFDKKQMQALDSLLRRMRQISGL